MAKRKTQFVTGEIYHLVIKAIDNLLFKDIDDHYRGIFSIYEFNTTTPITIREQRKIRAKIKEAEKEANRGPTSDAGKVDRQDKRNRLRQRPKLRRLRTRTARPLTEQCSREHGGVRFGD